MMMEFRPRQAVSRSFWVAIDLGVEQCTRCGAFYQVKVRELPGRISGGFACTCGHELNSWSGHSSYSYQMISIPQQERRKLDRAG